jgi:hypothetical protein
MIPQSGIDHDKESPHSKDFAQSNNNIIGKYNEASLAIILDQSQGQDSQQELSIQETSNFQLVSLNLDASQTKNDNSHSSMPQMPTTDLVNKNELHSISEILGTGETLILIPPIQIETLNNTAYLDENIGRIKIPSCRASPSRAPQPLDPDPHSNHYKLQVSPETHLYFPSPATILLQDTNQTIKMRWIYDGPPHTHSPAELATIQKITKEFTSTYQDEPTLTKSLQKIRPQWFLRFYYMTNQNLPSTIHKIRKNLKWQDLYHNYSYEPYSIYQS